MKKIVLSLGTLMLLGSSANAELLVGVDYNAMSSMTATQYDDNGNTFGEYDFSYQPMKFKVGLGTPGEDYIFLYYQSTQLEGSSGGKSPEDLTEFGYEYVGQFETGLKGFHPFWQFGAAFGMMDGVYANADVRYAVSADIGAGLSYYVIPQVELLVGANLQGRIWQPIDYGYSTIGEYNTGYNVTFGVNLWPFASGSSESSTHQNSQSEMDDSSIY